MKMTAKLIAAVMLTGVMTLTGCSVRSTDNAQVLSFTQEKADSMFIAGRTTRDDVEKILSKDSDQKGYTDCSDTAVFYHYDVTFKGEEMTAEQKAKVPEKYISKAEASVVKNLIFRFDENNVLKDTEVTGYYLITHMAFSLKQDFNRRLTKEEADMFQTPADAVKIPVDNPNAPDKSVIRNGILKNLK